MSKFLDGLGNLWAGVTGGVAGVAQGAGATAQGIGAQTQAAAAVTQSNAAAQLGIIETEKQANIQQSRTMILALLLIFGFPLVGLIIYSFSK